ncbi:Glycosyltransferase, GT2 family [Thermoactinomyces sp. DSM 45892]|nr:bifunctional glycosyltransferase family 2 protein/class I SAM-dependent methyltransferase [Thermoactinomyces sp. DSM 45892]SDZ17871.1 Glycosyltransferase, GT2 family [Thermoactinomyces sp. DSM 45892]
MFPIKVSIIILTYNQVEFTKRCVESIYRNTPRDQFELIFVDNGSSDDTVKYLTSLSDVSIILNEKNVGFAGGCNQGGTIAKGEYILFLNNDVIVTKNWLEPMLERLIADPKIGMVGPVSNYVSGAQIVPASYHSVDELDDFAEKYCKANQGKTKRVLRLVGFCLLARKTILDEIGWFDVQYVSGNFEDDDLCLKVLQKGYQLWIAFDSFVHHFGHATFNGNPDLSFQHLYHGNYQRYIEKWNIPPVQLYPRYEIVKMIPTVSRRILDVGCSVGTLGAELLNRQNCEVYGIEISPIAANIANAYYQDVQIMDVENMQDSYAPDFFDTIVFSNILEYLVDPWGIVQRFATYLKPGGSMIICVPNMVHANNQLHYLQGNGVSHTHLRSFTPSTIQSLCSQELFTIERQEYTHSQVDENLLQFLTELKNLGEQHGYSFPVTEHASCLQILLQAVKK